MRELAVRPREAAIYLRDLHRALRDAITPAERARIADLLVPEYVNRGDAIAAGSVLGTVGDPDKVEDDDLRGRLWSLRGLVAAMQGESSTAMERALETALDLEPHSRIVITQRGALGAYFLRDASAAMERALQAVGEAEYVGWHRGAAVSAMSLYGTSYHLLTDLPQAQFWLERTTMFASLAQDERLKQIALWAQYDLAAILGDVERHAALKQILRQRSAVPQYTEAIVGIVADALGEAWSAQFEVLVQTLTVGLERSELKEAQVVLLRGFLSLALVASGEGHEGRKQARQAMALARSRSEAELPYLEHERELGFVLAACAIRFNGVTARSTRDLQSRPTGSSAAAALARTVLSGRFDADASDVSMIRGYVLALAAMEERSRSLPDAMLTKSEQVVLEALAAGDSYKSIAAKMDRSLNTVRSTVTRLFRKLEAHNSREAIIHARQAGLLLP